MDPGTSRLQLALDVDDLDAAVDDARQRVRAEGLAVRDERGVRCCYARQDTFWLTDVPDEVPWEVYAVLGDVEVMREPDAACC